jgi:RecA/RadA recombinase
VASDNQGHVSERAEGGQDTAGGDTIADFTTATDMYLKQSQTIQVSHLHSKHDIQNSQIPFAGQAGGLETGSIAKLFGEVRTGKSQLCHTTT